MRHLLITLLLAQLGLAQTADWDRFRGPNGTGLAPDDAVYPAEIGPGQNEVWSVDFPAGMSSPVLSETHLFLTGVEDEKLYTYAVERSSGEVTWKREAPRPRKTKFHPKNHSAAASGFCALARGTHKPMSSMPS